MEGEMKMSNAAKSILVFGVYLLGLGAILLIQPNILLGLFGLPPTDEVWIRVVGMLALILAFYYIQAARAGVAPFFQWTIYARASVILFFIAFVLLQWARPALILFGVVDLLGALWTAWALRQAA
jgi:hypothetical protein